jgi:hypothetical protein
VAKYDALLNGAIVDGEISPADKAAIMADNLARILGLST